MNNIKKGQTVLVLAVILSLSLSFTSVAFSQGYVVTTGMAKRISYSCTNKPINEVLVDLADLSGIDIITSPDVTGNVTVKFSNIEFQEVLGHILKAHSLQYSATENMVSIFTVPQFEKAKEPLTTRVYKLVYADVEQVAGALEKFVTGKGKVAMDKSTSHIMVTDTPENISGIDRFIFQIDRETQQVLVEVRIYDVKTNEGFEIDPSWYVGRNTPLETLTHEDSLRNTGINSNAPTTLTKTTVTDVTGEGELPFSGDDAITGLDPGETAAYLPDLYRSYSIEDQTIETETEDILDPYGYNNTKYVNKDTRSYEMKKRKPFVSGAFDRETGGTINFGLLNDAIELNFALTMLHSEVEAKLLANPRILVLDNETADFDIIREIPYRELRQIAREDPITYTEFKDIGVSLKVTPHIARDGMIKLNVAPEFGALVSRGLDGAPTVDTRKVKTTALVENGQTIVLAGLKKKEVTHDVSKTPGLGDMPLIGGLFKSDSEHMVTSELVIFITTRIVGTAEMNKDEHDRYQETNFQTPMMKKTRFEKKAAEKNKDDDAKAEEISDILQQVIRD